MKKIIAFTASFLFFVFAVFATTPPTYSGSTIKTIIKHSSAGATVYDNFAGNDPDGNNSLITYKLRKTGDYAAFQLDVASAGAGEVDIEVKTPDSLNFGDTLNITMVLIDTDGDSTDQALRIAIAAAVNPTLSGLTLYIDEDASSGDYAKTSGSAIEFNGNDPDGGSSGSVLLTYSKVTTGSSTAFDVQDLANGKFKIKKNSTAINYEDKDVHTVIVKVTDRDSKVATGTFTINLNNINEAPVVTSTSNSITIPEDKSTTATIFDFDFTDADNNGVNGLSAAAHGHTFSIVSQTGGSGSSPFQINSSSGIVTIANINHLDYESMGGSKAVSLTVKVTDVSIGSSAAKSGQKTVTVNVSDVAESLGASNFATTPSGLTISNQCSKITIQGSTALLTQSHPNSYSGCSYGTGSDVVYRIKRVEKDVTSSSWSSEEWLSSEPTAYKWGTSYSKQAFTVDDYGANGQKEYAYKFYLKQGDNGLCLFHSTASYKFLNGNFGNNPATPASVSATAGSSSSPCSIIRISWSNVAPDGSYNKIKITKQEKDGFTYLDEEDLTSLTGTTGLASTSYDWTVPADKRGTIFKFNVYAINTNNPSSCQSSAAGSSEDAYAIGKPVPPEGVISEPGDGCTRINIEWENVSSSLGIETSPVNQYNIYKKVGSTTTLVDSVADFIQKYTDNSPDLGNLVSYWIEGENQCGEGEKSNISSNNLESLVGKPQNLAASTFRDDGNNQIGLEFTFTPADTVKHSLYQDGIEVAEIPSNTNSYIYNELEPCVFSNFVVGGVNGCGLGQTDTIRQRVVPVLTMSAINATDGAYPDKTEITWGDVKYETGYKVFNNNQLLMLTDEDVTFFLDDNSLPGDINTYRVQAVNGCFDSNIESDIGFADPNGAISGHINTANGSNVDSVEVEVTPVLGSSIKFNGTSNAGGKSIELTGASGGNHIDMGTDAISFSNGVTIEGWFYFDGLDQGTFLTLSNGSYDRIKLSNDGTNTKLKVTVYGCDANLCKAELETSNGFIKQNDWVHIAITIDNIGVTKIYKNGQLSKQGNTIVPFGTATKNLVGTDRDQNDAFDGKIDEIRVWETTRTALDIFINYDVELDGTLYTKLSRYFDLDTTGTTTSKIPNYGGTSPAPTEGDLNGTTSFASTSPVNPIENGSYVDIGEFDDQMFANGAFTLSIWMKANSGDIKNGYLFGGVESDPKLHFTVGRGVLNVANMTSENTGLSISGTTPLNDGNWHCVTYTYNQSTKLMKIYVDGNFEAQGNAGTVDLTDWHATIGAQINGKLPFKGFIDDVRIWKEEKSSDFIEFYHDRGLSGKEDNLVAYWKMDEGSEDLTFDRTENNYHGTLIREGSLTVWASNELADVRNVGITDTAGNYNIEAINYGKNVNGQNFVITPSKIDRGVAHKFNPINLSRNLSYIEPLHNGVDFIDISTMPISGYVKYHNTKCFIANTEMMLNGKSVNPAAMTNLQGVWRIDAPFGIQSFTPRDSLLHPDTITIFVNRPQAGFVYESFDFYKVKGKIDGNCGTVVGPAKVKIEADNQCFEYITDTDADGYYYFDSIPPVTVVISVIPDNQLITFDPVTNYILGDTTINFTYRTDLQAEVIIDTSLNVTDNCGNKFKKLTQGQKGKAEIHVFEEYTGGQRCYLDSAKISILDEISDATQPYDTSFSRLDNMPKKGILRWDMIAGAPFLGGIGENQYKKKLEVTVTDSSARQVVANEFILVEGKRQRASTFTTATPDVVFFILRDPPGDQSYSYIEKGEEVCHTFTVKNTTTAELELDFGAVTGASATAGWIAEVNFSVKIEPIELKVKVGGEISIENTDVWCYTLAQNIATDDGSLYVGRDMDLYVGGAMNYTFAKLDVLTYDLDNCQVDLETKIARDPEGLETFFVYTEKHVKEEVIPKLEELRDVPGLPIDSIKFWQSQVDGWNQQIKNNEALKAAAAPITDDLPWGGTTYNKNISFSHGASYDGVESKSFEYDIGAGVGVTIGAELNTKMAINIAGNGLEFGIEAKIENTTELGYTYHHGENTEIGYHLGDEEPGDYFSVNIKKDPIYNTPVFETVAGESMCPHEESTVQREIINLGMTENTVVVDSPDEPAEFDMIITNLSESEDDGWFGITTIGSTTGDGAEVNVIGESLLNEYQILVPGALGSNSLRHEVEVVRDEDYYKHENLQIQGYSLCERDNWTNGGALSPGVIDTVTFNAYWVEPCSDIEILKPTEGWVVDNTMNDEMQVFFTGYDTSIVNFRVEKYILQFAAQYGAWLQVDELKFEDDMYKSNTDGTTPQFDQLTWNLSPTLPDGIYKIRVKAICKTGEETITDEIVGIVSRNAPVVFGTPEPADGIYNADDEISVTFNENLDCSKLNVESVTLKGILSGFEYKSFGLQFDGVDDYGLVPYKNVYDFGSSQDFTVECWVKMNFNQNDPCILSNKDWTNGRNKGWAISTTQGNRWKFNIGDGIDMVNVNGGVIGDNQWHHIAVGVDRDFGIYLYQDGLIVAVDSSGTMNAIDDINNSNGVGVAQDGTGGYQYYFTGKIDEIRVWNRFKTQFNILQGRLRSYAFDEPNLLGLWRLDQEGSQTTFFDRSANENYGNLYNNVTWSLTDAAPISMDDVESLIDIDFNCANDKIIFHPKIPMKYMESATLTATVLDARDLHGNIIVKPAIWDFYVDQNPVRWQNSNLEFSKPKSSTLSFSENLVNEGGNLESYTLTDIPTWLSPSPITGKIPPAFKEQINFVVDSFVNPGEYNEVITAETDNGFEELDITVNVLCPIPDWHVSKSDYQNTMSITTALVIEGDTSKDVNDYISAFVDGQVRGVAQVQHVKNNTYLAFLNVFSDSINNETISFKIWDASECKEYPVTTPSLTFYADSSFGSIGNPQSILTIGLVAQEMELNKGWTWVSMYVNADSAFGAMPVNDVLSSVAPVANDIIKGQTGMAQYYPAQQIWAGNLSHLDNKSSYKLHTADGGYLSYAGYEVEAAATPIQIKQGWNYLGYPVTGNLYINTALSSINSILQTGDIIKSQYGYAEYVAGSGWFGSLKFLEPGVGYMLRSSGSGTLYFPAYASSRSRTLQNNERLLSDKSLKLAMNEMEWKVNPGSYNSVANITGALYQQKDEIIQSDRAIVAAFVNDEVRGIAQAEYTNNEFIYFLTVYFNAGEEEDVTFKAYLEKDGSIYDVQENLELGDNMKAGWLNSKFMWHIDIQEENVEREKVVFDGYFIGQNSPNPFTYTTGIYYGIPKESDVVLNIYNIQGQLVNTLINTRMAAGEYSIKWDGIDNLGMRIKPGVYYYSLRAGEYQETKKMVYVRPKE